MKTEVALATQPKGDDRVVLTIDELKELNKHGVLETLKALGIDTDNPQEVQRDFLFLRDWRTACCTIKATGVAAAVGIIITGALGALWLRLKAFVK